jgi:RNA polymerase sigma-70 factor, ECF subfamily
LSSYLGIFAAIADILRLDQAQMARRKYHPKKINRYNLSESGGRGIGNMEQETSLADISQLLQAWNEGDTAALDRLTTIVYNELRTLARRYLRGERPGHSLQTTALVNEAYIRLVDCSRLKWNDRTHFFAVSARVMRRILVDHARRQNLKRGERLAHISFDEAAVVSGERPVNFLALDEALDALSKFDARKAQIVELRYFGGLSMDEIAEALHVSCVTVKRDWATAKAWLYREMTNGQAHGS